MELDCVAVFLLLIGMLDWPCKCFTNIYMEDSIYTIVRQAVSFCFNTNFVVLLFCVTIQDADIQALCLGLFFMGP